MSDESGGFELHHIRNNLISFGIYRGMPSYAKSVLQVQLRYAHWPSGWVFVGRKAAAMAMGINSKGWLKGMYFLADNLFYDAWGYKKTKGQPAIAVKLGVPVPSIRVDVPQYPPREPWHSRSAKAEPLTLALLEAHFSTIMGEPWHSDKIKGAPIAFNSLEYKGKNVAKATSQKQQPKKTLNQYKIESKNIPGGAIIREAYNNLTGLEFAEFKREYSSRRRNDKKAIELFNQVEAAERSK